jgi:hypothetical protein
MMLNDDYGDYDLDQINEMRRKARAYAIEQARLDRYLVRRIHPLDFHCPCARCTRLRTPTPEDRLYLREMNILWSPRSSGIKRS